jgi:hypothetical protein
MAEMKHVRTLLIASFASAVLCLATAAAPAAAAEDPTAWMYSPQTIAEINLTLPPASWQELEEHPEDEYVPGTFSIAETDGRPGTAGDFTTPIEVGIRLKGGVLGSLRTLQQKAAFKIKFDSFVKGQTFLGLKKMTLNNMVEDPSMTHEAAAYEAFRTMGVPAPHAGFAYLRVNGESFGLHLNLESLDKIALQKQLGPFQDPQHLYEGEYGADVTPARVGRFEVDEGDDEDESDLEALVTAVASSAPSFSAAVGPLTNLDEMTRMWATEKYIGHWDGYSGRATEYQPNNFYLYSDAVGRFQMLPWGTDETWDDHLDFEGTGGALFTHCLGDLACKATYLEALDTALPILNGLDFDEALRCTAERLQPWQQLEAAERSASYPERVPFSPGQIAASVSSSRAFAVDRPDELADFLAVAAPPAPGPRACPQPTQRRRPAPSAPASPTGLSGTSTSPSPPLSLGRAGIGKRFLRLQVTVPGPGKIFLHGWIRSRKGHVKACAPGRVAAAGAGTIPIRCRLTGAVLRRLRKSGLRVHLKVDFVAAAGAGQTVERAVALRRR